MIILSKARRLRRHRRHPFGGPSGAADQRPCPRRETRLPRATVAKVLRSLAHAGVVSALRGAAGGYRLSRDSAAISVAEVVAAIDGAIGMTQCSVHEPACVRHDFCPTRPHWQRINLAIGQALSAVTLADMANPYGRPTRDLSLRFEPTVTQQTSDPIAS